MDMDAYTLPYNTSTWLHHSPIQQHPQIPSHNQFGSSSPSATPAASSSSTTSNGNNTNGNGTDGNGSGGQDPGGIGVGGVDVGVLEDYGKSTNELVDLGDLDGHTEVMLQAAALLPK